jgi:hypothetical protein
MSEDNVDIWDFLAYKIAKRMQEERGTPFNMDVIRTIKDELRLFNETNVIRIHIRMPEPAEYIKILDEVKALARNP